MNTRGRYGTDTSYDRFYTYDEKPKTYRLDDFSKGVSTKQLHGHVISSVMNMETDGRALFSSTLPQEETAALSLADGAITDHLYADGTWLFRKGKTLYARADGVFSLVGTVGMLAEATGAIFYENSTFYAVDGERILAIGHDLSVTETVQEIPICFTEVSRDGLSKTPAASPNPFSPYIDIVLSNESNFYQTIPQDIAYDPEYIRVFASDTEVETEIDPNYYSFSGYTLHLMGISPILTRVRLKLLTSEDTTKFSFSSSAYLREYLAHANAFSAYQDASGASWFVTWYEDEIMLIKRTENVFSHFSEDIITRITVEERIVSMMPYAEGYLMFTENMVKKVNLACDDLGEVVFRMEAFKQDVGSDMSGSICAFDDKILFASSRGGIFYVNKFGISERDVSRKVSENIEDGEDGFFSHTEAEYREACGVCAFHRYYLTVGNVTYIWRYGAKLPSSTQSIEDEESMVWTLSDCFADMLFLQAVADRLYLWNTKTETLCYLMHGKEGTTSARSTFTTTACDMDVFGEKMLTEIGVRYRSSKSIFVKLILDGRETAATYRLPSHETFTTAWLRPYAQKFEKAAVKVFSEGEMGVEAVMFRYI